MPPLRTLLVALIVLPLAACGPFDDLPPPSPAAKLPAVPTDIVACFKKNGVEIPDRDLTVAEVEMLWKQDRSQGAAWRRCGLRAIAWFQGLERRWR